jgi:L-alanine-DL-glutamate epimerase-like enolase superfamily enzyme
MLKAKWEKITLNFKLPSGTSRGVLTQKDSWIIKVWHSDNPNIYGLGEASIIKTLSPDWSETYEAKIDEVCQDIEFYSNSNGIKSLSYYPSIQLAIETAMFDLKNNGKSIIFESEFTQKQSPITINGLIWMGSKEFMLEQIKQKLESGFTCIKLKIGAINFENELELLKFIRSKYTEKDVELRVDANGAFLPKDALKKLNQLSKFSLHSIEQPIKHGQTEAMYHLCQNTPLPIALDEELIGKYNKQSKQKVIEEIKPQFIILKPSLIGGFKGADEWIDFAESNQVNWWITSALESNIGLNAIAQYTFTKQNKLPQGLGTGQLFTNNTKLHHTNKKLIIKKGQLILS